MEAAAGTKSALALVFALFQMWKASSAGEVALSWQMGLSLAVRVPLSVWVVNTGTLSPLPRLRPLAACMWTTLEQCDSCPTSPRHQTWSKYILFLPNYFLYMSWNIYSDTFQNQMKYIFHLEISQQLCRWSYFLLFLFCCHSCSHWFLKKYGLYVWACHPCWSMLEKAAVNVTAIISPFDIDLVLHIFQEAEIEWAPCYTPKISFSQALSFRNTVSVWIWWLMWSNPKLIPV